MSELTHLDLFITEATTSVIVDSFLNERKVERLTTMRKALIEPGELLSVDGVTYKKRYKIKLIMSSETYMMTAINEIIDGCEAYSRRAAGLTYPSIMYHVNFAYTNKAFIDNGIWKQDIYIDVEWGTS